MTKQILLIFFFIISFRLASFAQQKESYTPKIEPCDCIFKADSSLKTRCAYLVVPENRNKPNGKTVKLPFIYVESNNPNKQKDPVLYTAGGPGASSLRGVSFIHYRRFIKNRDYIAFEQRGTTYAKPCLSCDGISEAVKNAYRKNLPLDSTLVAEAKNCRKKLIADGNDLSAYNTIENAADIEDLRRALKIDSINLIGISYSGGLMLTVLRNYPQHIRSVILDSALPGFVNYEEDALFSINQSFNKVFGNCERDSSTNPLYNNIKQRFQQYFTSIGDKVFTLKYLEKGAADSISIKYRRSDIIDFLMDKLTSNAELKNVPYMVTQFIAGNQNIYMTAYFDNIFNTGKSNTLGMRYSMYCSEQINFADQYLIDKQNEIFPYLAGYRFNNVDHPLCNCWNVKSVTGIAKTPVYSNIPALLSTGDTDPYCPAFYNDVIHHFMPNSQRVLFTDKTHGPALNSREGDVLIAQFLDHPYQPVQVDGKKITTW
ncbi:alpha/beta fold hydrolase [Mucilaginibacter sp. OK098]|uniref:alpha/beta fold hydrolase n=1 Tax=Mucilaginibacter sp. OK098 TaxID=1855297 RepID=UPI00091A812C|nr:alpha/beta hydrolase [Mucilaginibacter sp. OK098]SHN20173.1 alpha/beta hydrolase fold [Mucilaginibacter sp. OK098]